MNNFGNRISNREAAVGGLAVVGFITLISASIWLAISATRFVPTVVNRVGEAAVYVGSAFSRASQPILSVITNPTLIPFEEIHSSLSLASSTENSANELSSIAANIISLPIAPIAPKKVTQSAGLRTTTTHEISGATTTASAPAFSGLPDFVVSINATGYLATTSAESFIASSTVPAGSRPAVKFTIKNIGSNVSGSWRFSASIPTQNAYIYQSYQQQPLAPGDSIDYTLGFDQATSGTGQAISITANFDRAVSESNMENNTTSTKITVLGL